MTAAQRGDRKAYVDVIRPRDDRLFAVAHRILRDVDTAGSTVLLTLSSATVGTFDALVAQTMPVIDRFEIEVAP